MGIVAIIQEALRIGRAHKSLWLFGFIVGLGFTGGSGGGGGGEPGAAPTPAVPPDLGTVALVVALGLLVLVALVILKFVSTGALIEGVKRVRGNVAFPLREGFREGWANWGVLFRIALLFFAANLASIAVLVMACMLVVALVGQSALYVAGGVALLIAVPWLVTLHIWQAFAERIAVLEDRHALDAVRKARLFLHGRLRLGLKLLVTTFVGVLFVVALGLVVIAPVGALVFASSALWGVVGAVALGAVTLLPLVFIVVAMIGIMTSSVWTIGYLGERQS